MIIFPAIDLYEGKAVRLLRGEYDKMTVYSENPIEIARDFEDSGAAYIHMVDLEGAKSGETPNIHIVKQVAKKGQTFTIVYENNGWGKIEYGAGWLMLEHVNKI